MKALNTRLARNAVVRFIAVMAATLSLWACAETETEPQHGSRAIAIEVEAIITAIDLETRQVSVRGPEGEEFTFTAAETIVALEDYSVGDAIVATYLAALEGEVREPTEEEMSEPYLVLEGVGIDDDAAHPAAGAARIIRAVCTIEGMSPELGTVTIKDPNGKLHVIRDVEAEKMKNVDIGDQIVMVYREALAISLERQ